MLFFLAISIIYSIFISFNKNIDYILNGISFSAAVVSIVVTAFNLFTLWRLETYKESLYKKEDCKIAIKRLNKILEAIDKDIASTNAGNCRSSERYIQESLSHIKALYEGNGPLENKCSRYLVIINNINIIDRENKDTFFDTIKAIITLHEKGE